MSGRLTFPLELKSPGGTFSHFCAFQCWNTSLILPMVHLLYLASFVAVSYWKPAFSQMNLVVSVVAVSILVASVVVVS